MQKSWFWVALIAGLIGCVQGSVIPTEVRDAPWPQLIGATASHGIDEDSGSLRSVTDSGGPSARGDRGDAGRADGRPSSNPDDAASSDARTVVDDGDATGAATDVGITNGEGDLADADTLADSDLTSDGDGPGRDAPYFSTCQQYLDHNPGAADGEVTLYVDHNPALAWTAHCADMAFGPKEFLTLVRTGNEVNFAQYTASIVAGGTDVRTLYTRLRLDPTSLEVDTGDQTFSSTSGHITQGGKVIKSMPYGVAAGCGNVLDRGEAQIDLRGTPFKVTDTFVPRGARPNGAATFSHDDQVVDIWGVGRCGWVAPLKTAYSPVNRRGGTLQLAHIRE